MGKVDYLIPLDEETNDNDDYDGDHEDSNDEEDSVDDEDSDVEDSDDDEDSDEEDSDDDENSNDVDFGPLVELGKVPKCPCCRREVGQWTTTHSMKCCVDNGCDFWDVNSDNTPAQRTKFDSDLHLLIYFRTVFKKAS